MASVRDRLRQLADTGQYARDQWMAAVATTIPRGATVLDVGAGPCRYRNLFGHCQYLAHDFGRYQGTSSGIHQDDWGYGPLDFISDITTLPVRTASVDILVCTEVLEHVPEPTAALAEIARALRPGGRLFLSAPLRSGLHQEPFHFFGGFTPHFYEKVFALVGLKSESVIPVGGLFSSLAEDSIRAGKVLLAERYPRPWQPGRWATRAVLQVALPLTCSSLERRYYHPEFTSDFLVEATKT